MPYMYTFTPYIFFKMVMFVIVFGVWHLTLSISSVIEHSADGEQRGLSKTQDKIS